jgi:hypothetical protein
VHVTEETLPASQQLVPNSSLLSEPSAGAAVSGQKQWQERGNSHALGWASAGWAYYIYSRGFPLLLAVLYAAQNDVSAQRIRV